jgi:hypothetical protein
MSLPIIACVHSAAGRLGRWLASKARVCWTVWSQRGRCSWPATIRSPSTLALRSLARDGIAMRFGRLVSPSGEGSRARDMASDAAHLARLRLARLRRWFPNRHFIVVGDTGYGTSETARLCQQHRRQLTVVSKFYGDASLYEPPPPRRTMGRPRVQGQRLPSPQVVVAHKAHTTRV